MPVDLVAQLLSDPLRPMGLSDIAEHTDPVITLHAWGQWHRRGLLPAPRWAVSRCPAWTAADFAGMLRDIALHFVPGGKAVRCGRTCQYCQHEPPTTWFEHERNQLGPALP